MSKEAKAAESRELKEVFIIVSHNSVEGVCLHGVFEDWHDAMRAIEGDPGRRIKKSFYHEKPRAEGRPE